MNHLGKHCQSVLAAAAGLGAAALLLAAGPAAAQGRSGAGAALEVVETFHPTSGKRTYRLQTPLSAGERQAVEQALAGAGYRPGPSDGRFTAATERALTRFQQDEELQACGCVTYETVRRLGLSTHTAVTTVTGERASSPRRRSVEVVYPTRSPPPPEPQAADSVRRPAPPDTVMLGGEAGPRRSGRWHGGSPGFAVPSGPTASPAGRAPGRLPRPAAGVRGRIPRLLPFVRPVIPRDRGR